MEDVDQAVLDELNSQWDFDDFSESVVCNSALDESIDKESSNSDEFYLRPTQILDVVSASSPKDESVDEMDSDLLDEFSADWDDDSKGASDIYLAATPIENDGNSPTEAHLEVLSRCFGHTGFRPLQWKILKAIIYDKKDVCAVMATGYGKSLCYQYPAIYMGGVTIVVSPLISLMEDQISSLKINNISACLLGTANSRQSKTIDEILENKYSMVYCTPEFITGDYGSDLLIKMRKDICITLIAIDEAHCISSWGHDFRFQYRHLGILKKIMPEVPVLAVTATATPKVRNDIVKSLQLKDPLNVCSGFDRPNLYFSVNFKGKAGLLSDLKKTIMEKIDGEWKFKGSTIIYCITRKETEQVSCELKANGINALPYHAGLKISERKENHTLFSRDKIDCIVATIAFGMGIDKPDVRTIVHYGASNSIESYYQEVGRAGRDGLPATCICFYSNNDFVIRRIIQENSYGSAESKRKKEALESQLKDYLITRDCRRKFILSHFEGTNANVPYYTMCCDNCTKKKTHPDEKLEGLDDKGLYDFTEDAKLFLETVDIMQGRFGVGTYVLFLRGSKSNKIAYFKDHGDLGWGKHHPEAWWKAVGNMLHHSGHLKKIYQKQDRSFFTYDLSVKGSTFILDLRRGKNVKLLLPPPPEIIPLLKKKSNYSSEGFPALIPTTQTLSTQVSKENNPLYQQLLGKRKELANKYDCMPYNIASDAAVLKMADKKPTTFDELRGCQLPGFSEVNIETFGESFLKIIRAFLNLSLEMPEYVKPNVKTQICPTDGAQSIQSILEKHPMPNAKFSSSARLTFQMFKTKMVEEIAKERGLAESTILSHLSDAILNGCEIKLSQLGITNETRSIILKIIRENEDVSLTVIKEKCPPHITFCEIRLVRTVLKIRQHLKELNIPYVEFEDFSFDDFVEKNEIKKEEIPSCSKFSTNELTEIDDLLHAAADLGDYDSDVTEILSDSEMPDKKKIKLEVQSIDKDQSQGSRSTSPVVSQNNAIETNRLTQINKKLPPWMQMKKI